MMHEKELGRLLCSAKHYLVHALLFVNSDSFLNFLSLTCLSLEITIISC